MPRLTLRTGVPSFLIVACWLVALTIVTPAPMPFLGLVAVVASEWSLWLAAVSAFCVAPLLWRRRPGLAGSAVCMLAASTIAICFYPYLSARRVAQSSGAHLSLKSYLQGKLIEPATRTTLTYAVVDGHPLSVDVYQGKMRRQRALIVVHGGSWHAGHRSDFPVWNNWLASLGFTVFDIDYRFTPKPNWQQAVGDVKCAVAWVGREAARFDIDPQQITLLGRSAGAHLALLAAYTPHEARLPSSCGVANSRVSGVLSLYGVTDLAWGYHHVPNPRANDGQASLREFVGGTPETLPSLYHLLSPRFAANDRSPRTLAFHGGRDQLVGVEQLSFLGPALGPQVRTILLPYAQHGFDYNFNGWGAQIARVELLRFLTLPLHP